MSMRINKRLDAVVNIYGLYDSRNPIEIRYVGKTVRTVTARLMSHLDEVRRNKVRSHKNSWIRRVLADGGRVELLALDRAENHTDGCALERHYIVWFKAEGHRLTNLTDGGDGTPGWVPDEEFRRRVSERRRGQQHTDESRAKMSASLRGRPLTTEHRMNIGIGGRGRKHSEATRAKQRAAHLGKPKSTEARARMSAAQKGRPGRVQSEPERTQRSITVREWWAARKAQMTPEGRAQLSNRMREYRAAHKDL